jgi:hypothetical protein
MEITDSNKKTKKEKQAQARTNEVPGKENIEKENEAEDDRNTPMINPPTPIDIKRECRFSVIMTVPPSNEPWKAFSELLRQFMKFIHDQASDKIHISTWDSELEGTEKRIKKPKDFPEGLPKNR